MAIDDEAAGPLIPLQEIEIQLVERVLFDLPDDNPDNNPDDNPDNNPDKMSGTPAPSRTPPKPPFP